MSVSGHTEGKSHQPRLHASSLLYSISRSPSTGAVVSVSGRTEGKRVISPDSTPHHYCTVSVEAHLREL